MTLPLAQALERLNRMIADLDEGVEHDAETAMIHARQDVALDAVDYAGMMAKHAATQALDAAALRTLRDALPSQKEMEAMKAWLDYGQDSLFRGDFNQGHRGYFSAGGWPYEQLKALHARLLRAYEAGDEQ